MPYFCHLNLLILLLRYLGSMLMSNYSLKFVDYPTSVLAKSVKPIPGTENLLIEIEVIEPTLSFFFVS